MTGFTVSYRAGQSIRMQFHNQKGHSCTVLGTGAAN